MKKGKHSKEKSSSTKIRSAYLESKDWNKVLVSDPYLNEPNAKSILLDYVEELYKTKVTGVDQLRDLLKVSKDLQDEVEYAFIVWNYNKYYRSLTEEIKRGKKYKDLFKITPANYNLPNTWRGCNTSDHYTTILRAVGDQFYLKDFDLAVLPGLRKIAKELEAPFSVIMDAFEAANPIPVTLK